MSAREDRTPEDWRDDLLEAALVHIPFEGWHRKAIVHGATDLGLDEAFAGLVFPGGPIEMLDYWMARADEQMTAELERRGIGQMRIRERITMAVRVRLELVAPHREAVRRAAGVLALPQHADLAARSLWRTVDAMWRAAGDTATDYNYYTKRAILSGVYSSTLLVWLGDESEDFEDTWHFLDRRIENVMQFEKVKARALKGRENWPSLTRFLGRLRYPPARWGQPTTRASRALQVPNSAARVPSACAWNGSLRMGFCEANPYVVSAGMLASSSSAVRR